MTSASASAPHQDIPGVRVLAWRPGERVEVEIPHRRRAFAWRMQALGASVFLGLPVALLIVAVALPRESTGVGAWILGVWAALIVVSTVVAPAIAGRFWLRSWTIDWARGVLVLARKRATVEVSLLDIGEILVQGSRTRPTGVRSVRYQLGMTVRTLEGRHDLIPLTTRYVSVGGRSAAHIAAAEARGDALRRPVVSLAVELSRSIDRPCTWVGATWRPPEELRTPPAAAAPAAEAPASVAGASLAAEVAGAGAAPAAIRMPLQTGRESASALVWGTLPVLAGVFVLAGIAAVAGRSLVLGPRDAGLVLLVGGLVLGCGAAVVVRGGVRRLRRVLATRASDFVLEPTGARIEGGPHDGAWISREELARVRWVRRVELDRDHGGAFVLERPDGASVMLVRSSTRGELMSLAALEATLAAFSSPCEPGPARADVLRCSGCGAAVEPADAARVACRFCGRDTTISDALRSRVRAAAAIERRQRKSEQLVRSLLGQPRARTVNMLSLVPGAVAAISFPILAGAGLYNAYHRPGAGMSAYFGLFVVALILTGLAVGAASLMMRLLYVDRVAFSALTRLAARRDARGQLVCQACSAPLAPRAAAVIARCVYCDSDNVLGIDLLSSAVARVEDHASLEAVASRRRWERAGAAVGALIAIGMLVASYDFVASMVSGARDSSASVSTWEVPCMKSVRAVRAPSSARRGQMSG